MLDKAQLKKLARVIDLEANPTKTVALEMERLDSDIENIQSDISVIQDDAQKIVQAIGDIEQTKATKQELEYAINSISLTPGSRGYKGEKGDPGIGKDGKDGYTPVKNKDYFDGKDGYTPIKGKDYFDGVNGLNAVVDYERVVNEVTSLIDIQPESPEEIRNKLELLQGDERLDKSAIKGIKELEDKIEKTGATIINQGGITRQAVEELILENDITRDTLQGVTDRGATTDNIITVPGVQFDITPTLPAIIPTGFTYYDQDKLTLATRLPNGVTLQHGRELLKYGKNASGVAILNGQAVSITSVGGSFTTFELTDATDPVSSKAFIGVATTDIPINGWGEVNISGLVNDIDTSLFNEGVPLYVDCNTPGNLTMAMPDADCYVVVVGKVEYSHAVHGSINVSPIVYPSPQDLSLVNGTPLTANGQIMTWNETLGYHDFDKNINDYKTYSGFENRTDSTISIDGSGVFTLAPAVTSFDVYTNGTGKHTIFTTQTVTITADQTITYVYIDNTGTLQKSTSIWDLASGNNAPCSIIFKDGNIYKKTDERHGYERNRAWHKWAHFNIGAMYYSGLTGVFTSTTLSVTQGLIYDEDIPADTISTRTTTSLWYRNATNGMRVITGSTTPFYAPGGVLKYDIGTGTLADVGLNKYTTQWVYSTNDPDEPIYTVIGQNDDTLLTTARNATKPIINLSTAEWKLIYRVIFRNSAGTAEYIESADFRTVQTGVAVSGGTATDHSSLTGRDSANSHPASAITFETTNLEVTTLEVIGKSKTLTYNGDGTLNVITTASGTKTMGYNGDGTLASITGTGIYKNKTFTYTGGALTAITV